MDETAREERFLSAQGDPSQKRREEEIALLRSK